MSKKSSRQKRQRVRRNRLAVVCAAAVFILILLVLLGSWLIHSLRSSSSGTAKPETSSQAVLSDDSASRSDSKENEKTDLLAVKNAIREDLLSRELSDLEDQINAYFDAHQIDRSKVSWAIQDLTTGAVIESDNAAENFTAASTYKLPLCAYYYQQIEQGKIDPNTMLAYTADMEEKEDVENLNQPIHRKYKVGDQIPIDELLEAALLYSDNIAGHMLYENLGGYTEFKKDAATLVSTPQASDFFISSKNGLNADYMMKLLYNIYNTPGTYNDLKYWLQQAATDVFLNRDLYGHYIQKIGNLNESRNAVGISNTNAPYSLSIYSCISKETGENLLADLGVLCYQYFQNKYASGFYDGTDQEHIQFLNSQMSSPVDVINNRPGPNGQILQPLTPEQIQQAIEVIQND